MWELKKQFHEGKFKDMINKRFNVNSFQEGMYLVMCDTFLPSMYRIVVEEIEIKYIQNLSQQTKDEIRDLKNAKWKLKNEHSEKVRELEKKIKDLEWKLIDANEKIDSFKSACKQVIKNN